MPTSAFDEPMQFGSGPKLTEGQKYLIELTDIAAQKKVVTFKEALRGKKDNKGKSVIGKEYDLLAPDMQALVDSIPPEFWPLKDGETEPREKARYTDRITFQFVEPITGIKFSYDAQFDVPSKKLADFVTRATGITFKGDEGYTWGNIFKKGEKFVATVVKRGNFYAIDTDSIVKEALAGPVAAQAKGELSATAKSMLDYIKANMVGKPKASVFDLFDNKMFGTYTETQKAWTEIQNSGIKFTLDGKTFGFEA